MSYLENEIGSEKDRLSKELAASISLKQDFENKRIQNDQANARLRDLQQQMNVLIADEIEAKRLQDAYNAAYSIYNRLQNDTQSPRMEFNNAQRELSRAQKNYDDAKAKANDALELQKKVESLEQQIDQLEKSLQNATSKNRNTIRNQINSLEKVLSQARSDARNKQTDIQRLNRMQTELDQAEAKYNAADLSLKIVAAKADEAKLKADELLNATQQFRSLSARRRTLETDLSNAGADTESKKRLLVDAQSALDRSIDETNKIQSHVDVLNAIAAEIAAEHVHRSALEEIAADLLVKVSNLQRSRDVEEDRIRNAITRADQLRRQIADLAERRNRLVTERAPIEAESAARAAASNQADEAVRRQTETVEGLRRQIQAHEDSKPVPKPFSDSPLPAWFAESARLKEEETKASEALGPLQQNAVQMKRLRDEAQEKLNRANSVIADVDNESRKAAQDLSAVEADKSAAELALPGINRDLAEKETAHNAATAKLVGRVPTSVPLLLFPVRIETKYVTAGTGTQLLVRVYPDQVHLNSLVTELTPQERELGSWYWNQPADDATRKAAWSVLFERLGSQRALWSIHASSPNFTPLPSRASSHLAVADMLPDRWLISCYWDAYPDLSVWTNPIGNDPLPVAPARKGAEAPSETPWTADPGLRWIVDFDAAVQSGMAVRIPLSDKQASVPIKRIVVVGVRSYLQGKDSWNATSDAALAEQEIGTLFEAHHYSSGLSLLPWGTPTNNTKKESSGFSSAQVADEAWEAFGLGTRDKDGTSDGDALSVPLSDVFTQAKNNGTKFLRDMGGLQRALWPVLGGTILEFLSGSGDQADVQRHFKEYVRSAVALPSFRVGRQPYAVLPVVQISGWKRDLNENAGSLFDNIRDAGKLLLGNAEKAPRVRVADDLERILQQDAFSIGWRTTGDNPSLVLREKSPLSSASVASSLASLLSDAESAPQDPSLLYLLARETANRLTDSAYSDDDREAFKQSITALQEYSDEQLIAMCAAILDAVSWRFDVWVTSLATQRLEKLLEHQSSMCIGAYGWVEDLQSTGPNESYGFVHAPSIRHAIAASVLQNAAATSEEHDRETYRVDLSSERVMQARQLLGGIREGNSLGSLLGYRFERALQDRHLSHYLVPFRVVTSISSDQTIQDAYLAVQAAEGNALEKKQRERYFLEVYLPLQRVLDELGSVEDAARREEQLSLEIAEQNEALSLAVQASMASGRTASGASALERAANEAAARDKLRLQIQALKSKIAELTKARDEAHAITNKELYRRRTEERDRVKKELDAATAAVNAADANRSRARQNLADLMTSQWGVARESLAQFQCVDGLDLIYRWRNERVTNDSTWIPFGREGSGLVMKADDQRALVEILQQLDDTLDSLSDLLLAEGVYQLISGNPERAAAAISTISSGTAGIHDPEVVRTPRTGIAITHRVMAIIGCELEVADGWQSGISAFRAQAEPVLNAWLSHHLPPPSRVHLLVRFPIKSDSEPQQTIPLTLELLNLCPLDVLGLTDQSAGGSRSEIESRVLCAMVSNGYLDVGTASEVQFDAAWMPEGKLGQVSLADFLAIARTVKEVLSNARFASAKDFHLSDEAPVPPKFVEEIEHRASKAFEQLTAVHAKLTLHLGAESYSAVLLNDLLSACPFGIREASAIGGYTDPSSHVATVLRALDKRISQSVMQPVSAFQTTEDARVQDAVKRLKTIFGPDFHCIPRIAFEEIAVDEFAFTRAGSLTAENPFVVEDWLLEMARVRANVMSFVRMRQYTSAVAPVVSEHPLQVLQLPVRQEAFWVALPPPLGEFVDDGQISIVQYRIEQSQPVAAFIIDEWVETIPSKTEVTSLGFHFNRPDAQAPQAILLAVAPDIDAKRDPPYWDALTLLRTVTELESLARIRVMPPEDFVAAGLPEPAIYLPANTAFSAGIGA